MFARWYVVSLREQKRIEEERRRQEELEQERLLRQKEMEDNQVIEDSLKYVSVGQGERARGLIELSLFTLNYHQAQLLETSSMSKFIHKIMPSLIMWWTDINPQTARRRPVYFCGRDVPSHYIECNCHWFCLFIRKFLLTWMNVVSIFMSLLQIFTASGINPKAKVGRRLMLCYVNNSLCVLCSKLTYTQSFFK